MIDAPAIERTPAAIQRSLAAGRCAACDAPVEVVGRRRRTCLCPRCQETLAWCSGCQRPHPHAAFARNARAWHGLDAECKAFRAARRGRREAPRCARSGCYYPAAPGGRGRWHKLCAECLKTHAWCSGCDRALPRRLFAREVREGRRHAAECRECDRRRTPPTGAAKARAETARATWARIAEHARAHPADGVAEIMAALGVTETQVRGAMLAHGFTVGQRAKRARAEARWREAIVAAPAELADRYGISYRAAVQLRSRARRWAASQGGGE